MIINEGSPDQLLAEVHAAKLLAVSPRTLRNWRTIGNGPDYIKISGRCVRYRLCDLIAFINKRSRRHSSSDTTATTNTE